MISFGITPIPPGALLGRLEKWVQKKAALTADSVFLSLAPDDLLLKFPPGDRFATIFPSRFPPWQGVVTGAGQSFFRAPGEENLGFDAEVVITCYSRFNVDQELRSSQLIRDASFGMMGVFAQVLGAVQMWEAPTDDDETVSYLREPMRVSGPATVIPRNFKDTFWTLLKVPYEMRFTAAITATPDPS